MTESVWISDVLAHPDLVLMMETDIVANDALRAIEAIKLLKAGKSVAQDMCPSTIWAGERAKATKRLPDLFLANSYPIVSERAAAILGQFNLGEGALHPVGAVYDKDRTTRFPGTFFCWIFGNTKSAFSAEHSTGMRPFAPNAPGGPRNWWSMPFVHQDAQLAVSAEALAGPDVWVDPTLFKSIFVSGPLGNALDAAGLTGAFHLFRCRVV
jgi:hypothetical protein